MSTNKRQTYNSPVGFIGLRKVGAPFTVSEITNTLKLPRLISPLSEEFKVGSMLTHINEACVCKSHSVPTLLAGVVFSIAFVNNYEAWEAVKNNPTISFGQQVSLAKNGFLARVRTGFAAVLTVVSANTAYILLALVS